MAELRARQERESLIRYLLTRLPMVPPTFVVVKSAIPAAEAIDAFRKDLNYRLRETLNINLWQWIDENGRLLVEGQQSQHIRTTSGKESTKIVTVHRAYAQLRGNRMLCPTLKPFASRLLKVRDALQTICFDNCTLAVEGMDDQTRALVAKTIGREFKRADELLKEMEDVRQLIGPIAVPTLRRWAQQEGCPIAASFDRQGNAFLVGTRSEALIKVVIPEAMEANLGTIPPLSVAPRLDDAAAITTRDDRTRVIKGRSAS